MNKPTPLPLRKPFRRCSHLVELYEDETADVSTAEADSVAQMLENVDPKAPFPDTNVTVFDFGAFLNSAVLGISVVGHAISSAVSSAAGTMNNSSGTYSTGANYSNPPVH